MKSNPRPPQATYQDVLDAPETQIAELIEGRLHTSPRPPLLHANAADELEAHSANIESTPPRAPEVGGSSTNRSFTSEIPTRCSFRTGPAGAPSAYPRSPT